MVCYACEPGGATEHGLGWQWVLRTSQFKDVILITRPGRKGLAEECNKNGIELVEVEVPSIRRKLTQPFGDVGIWIRIYSWASNVNKHIKKIVDKETIEYVHLVTFHSIWMPNIFKGVETKKIWGPVSGGEYVPSAYMEYVGPENKKEKIRNRINRWMTKRLVNKAKSCDLMICGNSQTLALANDSGCSKTALILPNAVSKIPKQKARKSYSEGECLNFAFVGSCQGRRTLTLLMSALAKANDIKWKLDIAGTGPALRFWKQYAKDLLISDNIEFHGWVGKDVVDMIYQRAHIFAFTTIRDGGGSGMLEALERGVPVLALDWGGPADVIADTGAGKLITADSPETSIAEIKSWVVGLAEGKINYSEMVEKAENFNFEDYWWETKLQKYLDIANAIKKS